MDIHHILAQNREEEPAAPSTKASPEINTPPVMGILTSTITRSPVYNWIIPARIRHKDKNDVICIGDNFVEIKELLSEDNHLRDIVTKSDFGSTIRAARVFGTARKSAVSRLDAIIKPESDEMDLDVPSGQKVPPQILVLALESKELVFLFAIDSDNDQGHVNFLTSRRPLPEQRSYLEQHGKHVAVDPKSRALAVAACEGSFSFYALRSMDQLRSSMEGQGLLDESGFDPVKEERHFSLDGVILKMEFLYPPAGDKDHVILMLIVSQDNQTRLLWYDWDCSTSLRTVGRLGTFGQLVMKLEQLPLLLIPLTISSAFMLICEKTISVYRDVLTGNATRKSISFHSKDAPIRPGSSRRAPLWTYWARPVRTKAHTSKHDDLYICREDGMVRFLEISEDSEIMVDASMKVGILGCNIDTAFASLDLGLDRDDLLFAGGDMSYGGLYSFQARQNPDYIQCIPNWAPSIEFITAAVNPSETLASEYSSRNTAISPLRDRLFTGAGRGCTHASVAELRFGLQARMGTTIDLDDSSILRLWTLPDAAGTGLYFLFAHSLRSSLLHFVDDESTAYVEPDESTGLDFGSSTLAAGTTPNGLVLQVTERSIRVTTIATVSPRFLSESNGKIVAATIEGETSSIITAVRGQDAIMVHLARVAVDDMTGVRLMEVGLPLVLRSEPTCLSVERIERTLFAFVGTAAGTLQIFHMSLGSGLLPLLEQPLAQESDRGTFAVCESFATATSQAGTMLACGLRNGIIKIFKIALNSESAVEISLSPWDNVEMGTTSVTVKGDISQPRAVFALCGTDFCCLEFSSHNFISPAVHRIWLTDRMRTAYQQTSIKAVTQVGPQRHFQNSGLVGSLICILGKELVMIALDDQGGPRIVPRRIAIGGTPTRIIFSKYLNRLIVGYMRLEIRPARQGNGPGRPSGKRFLRPALQVIDPDSDSIKPEPMDASDHERGSLGRATSQYPIGKAGERILGMLEWNPTEGNKVYHMLVLTTIVNRAIPPQAAGKVLFFNLKTSNEGRVDVKFKHHIKYDKPVYSVAAFGASSLIYCCGTELVLHTLRLPDKKWLRPIKHTLGSPSLHISVAGLFIYVTTARHSLTILKVENDELRPQFSDRVARDGIHHLNTRDPSVTLVSDKACSVIGLWQPPQRRTESSAFTLFEAILPKSITRLRNYTLSNAWWSSPTTQREIVLGSSADGTFYRFLILSETSWRLLRFVQNLALRNRLICPFQYSNPPRKHIEPSTKKKHYMHVDGDVLIRLVTLGGASLLQAMLEQEPHPDNRFHDYETAAARYSRFCELIRDVAGGDELDDPVQAAIDTIRNFLVSDL